ncbi:lysine N(6)-hydroxylase/L-ornithine N(5)-oxygenase family protein [Pseudonocardia sp. DSM 110487]|uniref:lysine N(6)-hydroxylase/L-ornithine N(5)-oxygenase family protein n=1 Tax=Pseudonocardia sp. DSM 110487 TaxID=2865833 RepID=UPI001C69F929|nr:SidA/IucD/PvdA family monooxygenase [Pseudonocardia sp. DSM 110487]QYN38484.1 lysine N(6)-hydroxylase/L-ornithine N(5)-oxygenase family protein [Pseudonocardia sp. DSM 110487]
MPHDDHVLDVVGVGFGPANLGLAIAVAEHNVTAERPITALFLERQEAFGWHRGMLIPDARMQVAFLKDLATLRNPTSNFGFISYLAARGRLVDFVNRQTFFPTRLEFHDYLSWAAAHFDDDVSYGTTVEKIEQTGDGLLAVTGRRGGESVSAVARAVVIATGLAPALPDGVESGERIWHNSQLVPGVAKLATGPAPRRFVVVGAGQSAAESVDYLHRSFPDADVHAVFRRWGYSPADDSAFANRVFDPDAAQEFYAGSPEVRGRVTTLHRNTNYSVVDPDLIESLYERHYAERVEGRERLRFDKMCTVEACEDLGDRVRVRIRSSLDGTARDLDADVIVYATGYRSGDPTRFLAGPIARRDDQGRVRITADYRLELDGSDALVYVQGATEHTHGLASTLLSNIAVRTGDILASLEARIV